MKSFYVVSLVMGLCSVSSSYADSHPFGPGDKGWFHDSSPWEVSGRAGTLGVGPEIGYHQKNSHWGIRLDFDTYKYSSQNFTTGKDNFYMDYQPGINATGVINTLYSGRAKLMNGSIYGDYYPWKKSGFRLTGGLIFNKNNFKFQARGQATGQLNIQTPQGNMTQPLSVDDPGHLDGKGKWNFLSPYVGIGWNTELGGGFYFNGDFGAMFQRKGHLNTQSSGLMTQIDPELYKSELGKNVRSIRHYMNIMNPVYPVLMIGFGYRF